MCNYSLRGDFFYEEKVIINTVMFIYFNEYLLRMCKYNTTATVISDNSHVTVDNENSAVAVDVQHSSASTNVKILLLEHIMI